MKVIIDMVIIFNKHLINVFLYLLLFHVKI
jgi:hypothetical protein